MSYLRLLQFTVICFVIAATIDVMIEFESLTLAMIIMSLSINVVFLLGRLMRQASETGKADYAFHYVAWISATLERSGILPSDSHDRFRAFMAEHQGDKATVKPRDKGSSPSP